MLSNKSSNELLIDQSPQLIVINIIGGPGIGKTTMACGLYAELKKLGYSIEYVSEYAKSLVWAGELDKLNDQFAVSHKQYCRIKQLKGKVQYAITDSPILLGLYYNAQNPRNVCDVLKVREHILRWDSEFSNINIFLQRHEDIEYVQAGRVHTKDEALDADQGLENIYLTENVKHTKFYSTESYNIIADYIKILQKHI